MLKSFATYLNFANPAFPSIKNNNSTYLTGCSQEALAQLV